MTSERKIWLLSNTASGSYSESAVDDLSENIRQGGFDLDRTVCFPTDELPGKAELDDAGVDILAIFTGDGTINSTTTSLYGWKGAVLPLPGGTMNLLSKKLHGDVSEAEIIERVSGGDFRKVRMPIVRSGHGDALVGFMGGPATSWYNVREAMRDIDIAKMLEEASEAMRETMQDPQICIAHPDIGSKEGYPLVEVVPTEQGLEVIAYNPQSLGDYLRQGWVTLLRQFREGPHDNLGTFNRLTMQDVANSPLFLSIDGEPLTGEASEELVLATAEVDLLATA